MELRAKTMINPNRGITEETLRRLSDASYERFRLQLIESLSMLMNDFQMTWDDLTTLLSLKKSGDELRKYIGEHDLTIKELNAIAHVFSTEPYLIFKARFPWTQT